MGYVRNTTTLISIIFLVLILFQNVLNVSATDIQGATSSLSITGVLCNWTVAPLERILTIDPGQSSFTTINLSINTTSNSGAPCNQGGAFGLVRDGAISSWMSLNESSFSLEYNQIKMIGINVTVPNNATLGMNYGHINVSNTTITTQVDINVNVTDNVGNASITVTSSGVPVSGATVRILNSTTLVEVASGTTNSSGMWQSNWLPIGDYTARVSKTGYDTNNSNFNIAKLTTTQVTVTLTATAGGGGPGGGGGGAGGGGIAPFIPPIFPSAGCISVDREVVKTKVMQGGSRKEPIKIRNTCDRAIDVKIDVSSIMEFIDFQEGVILVNPTVSFSLDANQEQMLFLNFRIADDQEIDVYSREIYIKSEGKTTVISIVLDIISKAAPLFDILVEVPPAYQEVYPGEHLVVNAKLYNFGAVEKKDYIVDLYVKDSQDNIILQTQRTIAVETQASFTETFVIPSRMPYGTYIVYGKVPYQDKTVVSSALFHVVEPRILGLSRTLFWILLVVIIIFIGITFAFIIRSKRLEYLMDNMSHRYRVHVIKNSVYHR